MPYVRYITVGALEHPLPLRYYLKPSAQRRIKFYHHWRPCDQAIVPPPKILLKMDECIADTPIDKIDFYLAKKDI